MIQCSRLFNKYLEEPMPAWLTERNGGVLLTIRVVPRAAKTGVSGEMGDALKIRLQAPPVEGKANKALIEFIAERLGCSKSAVSIAAGDKGRNKLVFVANVKTAEVLSGLQSE